MKKTLLSIAMLLCGAWSATAQEPKPTPRPPQASGGGAIALEPAFKVIRSLSGTKLIQDAGRSLIEDPRTVFYAPADREIIVYFTWEGPPGLHRFEGLWKNPGAKVTMTSEFEHKSEQRRVGGYFKMLPGDNPTQGTWTLEARIDGEPAGSHSFEIVVAARPESATKPVRRPLGPSEIYNRAAAASVLVENINAKGTRRNVGSGFFIGPGKLLTAFQVIDGAAKVRVVGPQGAPVEVSEVVAFNRRQDWIVFNVALENVPLLERNVSNVPVIGDRGYFLDVPAEGNRVLVDTGVIGKHNLGPGGERFNIADTVNKRAIGSPLLNEFGEVIGLIGGSLVPGSAFLEDLAFGVRSATLEITSRGTLAVPISLVKDASTAPTTIDALASSGQFIPPLVNTQIVLGGTLAGGVNKKTNPPQPIEEKIEFSRSRPSGVLILTWLPKEKRKGFAVLRLYDLDNKLLGESPSKKKITVGPDRLVYSMWELDLTPLRPGIFRIDVTLDGEHVWRTFFRVIE